MVYVLLGMGVYLHKKCLFIFYIFSKNCQEMDYISVFTLSPAIVHLYVNNPWEHLYVNNFWEPSIFVELHQFNQYLSVVGGIPNLLAAASRDIQPCWQRDSALSMSSVDILESLK